MAATDSIKLIECPRDAWQGLKGQVPAELKTNYLQALISAGFRHIDAVSFVLLTLFRRWLTRKRF